MKTNCMYQGSCRKAVQLCKGSCPHYEKAKPKNGCIEFNARHCEVADMLSDINRTWTK